jgi:hypothetical protein
LQDGLSIRPADPGRIDNPSYRDFSRSQTGAGRRGGQRLNRSDVKERADFEFGRYSVLSDVDANEQARSSQQSHFGMPNLICLTARHYEPKRLERPLRQQIAKGLQRHAGDFKGGTSLCKVARRRAFAFRTMSLASLPSRKSTRSRESPAIVTLRAACLAAITACRGSLARWQLLQHAVPFASGGQDR